MTTHDILLMMGLVISASIGTLILAEYLRVPAIMPLLGMGLLLGPELLGLVDSNALGSGLRVLIPLMVAIIIFEGGMALDITYLRQVSRVVRNLISIGCLVTVVFATLAARYLVGLDWGLALLFGALVSVTGPTVITPLLRRAAVTQRLKTILMAEGVLIDAVGAVLAVVVLEVLVAQLRPWEGVSTWLIRVGGGTLFGIAAGWLLGLGLRRVGRSFTAELTRLSALGGALAIYTLAESFSHEAGIAAAAAAGIVVGNMSFPHAEQVHHLKGDLTMLGIGVIFILLAARLRIADLLTLGWGGLLAVVALILVVRPACVFVSTLGTSLSWRERAFLAAVGPRGIVAASFATFAALRLEDAGYGSGQALSALVFLVIIGTVLTQSFTTSWFARVLGVQPMLTLVVGADPIGRELARHLQAQGEEAVLLDRDASQVALAREEGLVAFAGDAKEEAVLRRAGITRAKRLVAATPSDKTNLLVCQLARSRFGLDDVVARVNDGANLKTFTDIGIRAMSPTAAAVMVLDNLLRRPNTLQLLSDDDPGKEVVEVTLLNGELVGQTLKQLVLGGDVLVTIIRRDNQLFVPHGATMLALGDELTLIGGASDVQAAVERFGRVVRPQAGELLEQTPNRQARAAGDS